MRLYNDDFAKPDWNFWFFLLTAIAINAISLFTAVMDQDSALYASIAKSMYQMGDWVNLMILGEDWLDKPHLPFWITALSFKIFGVSAFAYKFPSFLCCLVGAYYLFRMAQYFLIETKAAYIAVIIYLTSLHLMLSNFDVRAEVYLSTFIIAAIYHLYMTYKVELHDYRAGFYADGYEGWHHILLAGFFCAAALMTKGLFVLLTIGGGFIIYWITTKQWEQFVYWRWAAVILVIMFMILPELFCLLQQFDFQPDKIVFGEKNVSGLKFFFWDSQFGRFFNTGPIQGKGDLSFFAHTTLWAFLPWSVGLVMAGIAFLKRWKELLEKYIMICVWSAALTFLLFSFSKFQLPHYIVILLPHFSIFVAKWLMSLKNVEKRIMTCSVWAAILLLAAVIIWLSVYFPFSNKWLMAAVVVTVLFALAGFRKAEWVRRLLWRGICFSFLCAVFFSQFIYGTLMQYNAGMNAAQWINENCPEEKVILLGTRNVSAIFYLETEPEARKRLYPRDFTKDNQSFLVFFPEPSKRDVIDNAIKVEILAEFDYFRITMLTPAFLSSETRPSQVTKYVVARCTAKKWIEIPPMIDRSLPTLYPPDFF